MNLGLSGFTVIKESTQFPATVLSSPEPRRNPHPNAVKEKEAFVALTVKPPFKDQGVRLPYLWGFAGPPRWSSCYLNKLGIYK